MPISNIQTDETYTPMKKYLFLTLLAAAFLAGGGCSSSDDDGWGVIELASPKLKVTTELATATVTWDAVAKTAGYAYALDGAADYTSVDAATTTVTLTALAEGGHTFRLKAVGDLDHTTDSAERTIDFEIDPTLPQPAPTYVKGDEIGSVVVSWPAVKGAAGYAYKFGEAASFTEVGADVLSVTQKGLSAEEPIRFTMYAVGQLPDSKDSEPVSLTFQLVDTSEGVWVRKSNGELFELTESEAKIYTGTVSVSAADSFEILVENVPYGFLSYSGNGGVGKVENMMSAAPYYSSSTIADSRGYDCKMAVGRMAATADGGNDFWTNLSEDAQILVRVDLTYADGTPRYWLELVEADDPNLLLEQNFDLFVWGGDYTLASGGKGTAPIADSESAADLDGTEEGTKGGATYTTPKPDIWSTADGAADGDVIAGDLYLKNRNMTGWEVRRIAEHPGTVRLNKSASGSHKYSGYLKTPKLAALTAPTNITLEFDICRFAGDGDIYITVEGAGTYTAAAVNIDGAAAATTVAASGTDFVVTNDLCSKQANTVINKPWSHVELSIAGATAETQIKFDGSRGKDSASDRCLLDNIKITK